MQRRDFLRGIGVGLASGATSLVAEQEPGALHAKEQEPTITAFPNVRSSLPAVEWRLTTSWSEALDVMLSGPRIIAERVAAMTDGQFKITVYPGGEIAPPLGVLDAVSSGSIECGHTASFYFVDENEAFGISTGLPFGLTPQQQNAWLLAGGGMEAIQQVYADYNIVSFPAGGTGTQMGGWLREEITTLEDLRQIKFRIPGLGGKVMQRMGIETVVIPGSEVFDALQAGEIDAAEWIGPYDDEKLGLNRAATFYYYPGWWEPGSTLDVLVNRAAWEALPPLYRNMFKMAAQQAHISVLANYEVQNQQALVRLVAGGTQLRPYSEDILSAAKEAAFELFEETSSKNPAFQAIFEPWKEFRRQIYQWNRFNESSYSIFATENL
jgi:TRAP-type mannitol/chloroaromatic compound transport system substrate-binding protein